MVHSGVPQARWMVYVMEDPIYKWMMTGASPMTWESPINGELRKIDHEYTVIVVGKW